MPDRREILGEGIQHYTADQGRIREILRDLRLVPSPYSLHLQKLSFIFQWCRGVLLPGVNVRNRGKRRLPLETCELFRKFRLEGEYFCLQAKKSESAEEKPDLFLKNCRKVPEYSGKTMFCVLG